MLFKGPVLPKPSSLSNSPIFKDAGGNLTELLDNAASGSINAGWSINNVSFSLAVVSADQEDAAVPVWEYHHLASDNTKGIKDLTRDSQCLVGSISKVISTYILLKSGIDIDAPVVNYLPQLNNASSAIQSEHGFSEFYALKEVFLSIGFPEIEDKGYPPCGVTGLNGPCSPQDVLTGMTAEYSITAPMERPAYSNIAYTLFGLALENYTGKNYSKLVREIVARPLGLRNTFPSPGNDERAVIPPGESNWGTDYGLNAPPGGLVSSLSDLSVFAHGLLSRTLDLTPTETRQWLNPDSFAGGPYSMVGLPWEIFRPSNLTADHPHPVAIYGKGGGAQGYRSQLSVLDEYGIAIIVLTAGPMQAAPILVDTILATFVPAVDDVSREQAKLYEQNFTSSKDEDAEVQASLKQDTDSLVISSLKRNGTDLLSGLVQVWSVALGEFLAPVGETVRLFPADLWKNTTLDGKQAIQEVWRLWPDLRTGFDSELPSTGLENADCTTWAIGDWIHYGGEPLDRVLMYKNEDGEVVGLEIPFLRSGVLIPS